MYNIRQSVRASTLSNNVFVIVIGNLFMKSICHERNVALEHVHRASVFEFYLQILKFTKYGQIGDTYRSVFTLLLAYNLKIRSGLTSFSEKCSETRPYLYKLKMGSIYFPPIGIVQRADSIFLR